MNIRIICLLYSSLIAFMKIPLVAPIPIIEKKLIAACMPAALISFSTENWISRKVKYINPVDVNILIKTIKVYYCILLADNVKGMQRAGSVADSLSTVTALASEPGACKLFWNPPDVYPMLAHVFLIFVFEYILPHNMS